jgi:hypothetical protein
MKTPTLGREVMAAIGRELRLLYREIIVEGVPDHFAAILRRLDQPLHESTRPAASAPSQHVRRDDEVPNDDETHERGGLIGSLSALLAVCAHGTCTSLMAARRSK